MTSAQQIKSMESDIRVLQKELDYLQRDREMQRLLEFDDKLTKLLDGYDIPFNEILYILVQHFRTPLDIGEKLAKLAELKPQAEAESVPRRNHNGANVALEPRAEAVKDKWAKQFGGKSLDEWLA